VGEVHDAAVAEVVKGLIDVKILQGDPAELIQKGAHRKFFMHGTSHWLGLDVHDAGDYKLDGEWRQLGPGMVLTVEPGCYVRPGPGIPERYAGIGVRIEDDVAVTATGAEVLTRDAPKKPGDIEAWMNGRAA
jgi:Xaa-Pro aminopeptidase